MKKIVFLLALAIAVVSCGQKENAEHQRLITENDSLKAAAIAQTNEFNDALAILNEVEDNFSKIREAENYLTVQNSTTGELSKTQRERITDDFKMISEVLQKNKEQLDKLKSQNSSEKSKIKELQKTIERLQSELENKATTITLLQQELGNRDAQIKKMGEDINVLTVKSGEQEKEIKKQDKELNTAWYVFGTSRELKEMKVVDGKKVLQGNYDKSKFIKIDLRKETQIPLYAKKAKIMTQHPEGSYKLNKDANKSITIMILDPEKFWGSSKILVVEVD